MNRTLGFLLVPSILFGSLPPAHAGEKAGDGNRVPASQPAAKEKTPAGVLMLLPEATAGCNCGFPLQTTVVLAPAETGR